MPPSKAKLSSRDQVGCKRSLHEDQHERIQGSLAVFVARQPSRRPLAPLDSWILVFLEAVLAADLITTSVLKLSTRVPNFKHRKVD